MFRYLRIAILPLIAVLIPIPQGLADGIGSQPQISTAGPLIRVADQQCRRDCDADFAPCIAQARELRAQGLGGEKATEWGMSCVKVHEACYRAC